MEEKKKKNNEYIKRIHEGHNDANFDLLAKSELLTGKNTVEALGENTEKQIEASAENVEKITDSIDNINLDNTDIVNSLDENTKKITDSINNINLDNTDIANSLDGINKTLEEGFGAGLINRVDKIEETIPTLEDKIQSNTDLIDSLDMFGNGTQIPANSDLNDYIKTGKYYSNSGSDTTTMTNIPSEMGGMAFSMYVLKQSSARILQIITRHYNSGNNMIIYFRQAQQDGSTWYGWTRLTAEAVS